MMMLDCYRPIERVLISTDLNDNDDNDDLLKITMQNKHVKHFGVQGWTVCAKGQEVIHLLFYVSKQTVFSDLDNHSSLASTARRCE